MDKPFHFPVDDLILYLDGELAGDLARQVEGHLRRCGDCSAQLKRLKTGIAGYEEYRKMVLQPALETTTPTWSSIRERAHARSWLRWMGWSAAGLVAAAALVLAVYWPDRAERRETSDILTRAEAVPQKEGGSLVFSVGAQRWSRPSILRGTERPAGTDAGQVRALFVQAGYSWERPLSAHSYAAWRNSLAAKRDQVILIRNAQGAKFAYRLRTRTDSGLLRMASLTLRADTYHPTEAAFQFQGAAPLEITETSEAEPVRPTEPKKGLPRPAPSPTTETMAGPEEELRVLAALSSIGADAEEPVAVQLDAVHHQILVTAAGLAKQRQNEISAAVADLPATVVRFSAAQPRGLNRPDRDIFSAGGGSPFRQKLEEQAGGARPWQTLSDRALDSSNGLFAHAHSLLLLGQDFEPNVERSLSLASLERLRGLQQRHVGAIQYATRQLRETLRPVMANGSVAGEGGVVPKGRTWQSGALHLYEEARILDGTLDRFLTGNYDAETGAKLQSEISERLGRVESLVREQASAPPKDRR